MSIVFSPGDLVFCDEDGVVVIPHVVEKEVIAKAFKKVSAENVARTTLIGCLGDLLKFEVDVIAIKRKG